MKILLIHQAFVSGNEAGGTRHYELGQRLQKHGDHLTVVASQVGYLTGQRVTSKQSGLVVHENQDGIDVLRAYTTPVLHRGFVWRVLAFLIFAVTSVYAGLRAGKVDVVMGTTPPIFQAFSAWLVALLSRRPFLLEVRDLWPEFAIGMGVLTNPLLIQVARWGENFLYARANHILVNSPAYRDYLLKKGIPADKISFVANGVEVEMFKPDADGAAIRERYHLHDKFIVVYAGAHGPANNLGQVLQAADRLRANERIHFLMVGDGKDRASLEAEAQRLKLTNITFTGALPKSQMPEVFAAADLCLAILMNIPMFTTTYPNKVFDYMAAGRPTLLAIDGVIREVIENAHGGVYVAPQDDEALAAEIACLADNVTERQNMGRSAREYVTTHFNREQQAEEFRRVLQKVVKLRRRRLYFAAKRLFDFTAALFGLILLAPVILGVALAIFVTTGAPIFFKQTRPGQHGKPFLMIKFRTMSNARDAKGALLPDDKRLTRLGQFLRSTSLDELPELFNVLKGDMSLVGPRPLLMQYLGRYTTEQSRRHDVKPGITGWAQINGRNTISWEDRFKLDVWYVDHASLWLDIQILLRTVEKVLKREGISQDGQATMSEFMGSQP